jgi:hypothetical protein
LISAAGTEREREKERVREGMRWKRSRRPGERRNTKGQSWLSVEELKTLQSK